MQSFMPRVWCMLVRSKSVGVANIPSEYQNILVNVVGSIGFLAMRLRCVSLHQMHVIVQCNITGFRSNHLHGQSNAELIRCCTASLRLHQTEMYVEMGKLAHQGAPGRRTGQPYEFRRLAMRDHERTRCFPPYAIRAFITASGGPKSVSCTVQSLSCLLRKLMHCKRLDRFIYHSCSSGHFDFSSLYVLFSLDPEPSERPKNNRL